MGQAAALTTLVIGPLPDNRIQRANSIHYASTVVDKKLNGYVLNLGLET
jgi:hypothetical protein